MQSDHPNFNYPPFPQTLEDLELQYKREAMELARIRDTEEDEENCKHREALREIWESHTKKAATLMGTHANMWDEFLRVEGQRRQETRLQVPAVGFGGYKQSGYVELNTSSGNPHHSGDVMHSRGRYPNAVDHGYPYEDFQRQRRDDFGRPYHRY
ncbi:zinc knuckle (CCHC-type) family protein [Striga asiatica]|uniref:Zinc knuckle (CCHC-type) family protein n=1 Tax=Striga asiatica TaxID=4170 RepID=A0A5A7P5J2_STRAF|nr:zinc knuckle (CCHC-type) family protein [Striga asiatica]